MRVARRAGGIVFPRSLWNEGEIFSLPRHFPYNKLEDIYLEQSYISSLLPIFTFYLSLYLLAPIVPSFRIISILLPRKTTFALLVK